MGTDISRVSGPNPERFGVRENWISIKDVWYTNRLANHQSAVKPLICSASLSLRLFGKLFATFTEHTNHGAGYLSDKTDSARQTWSAEESGYVQSMVCCYNNAPVESLSKSLLPSTYTRDALQPPCPCRQGPESACSGSAFPQTS